MNSSTRTRPSRDEIFIRTAHLFAERSTCERGQVGCVIVKDKRIVSVGYNGAPANLPDCTEVGCKKHPLDVIIEGLTHQPPVESLGCQRTIHAELNAVAYAAWAGIPLRDSQAYCTHSPCNACAFALSQAGIHQVVYDKTYRLTDFDLLDELGMEFHQFPYSGGASV